MGSGACEMMKEMVFTDELIYPYINKHFIPVALDINKNDAPKVLQSQCLLYAEQGNHTPHSKSMQESKNSLIFFNTEDV